MLINNKIKKAFKVCRRPFREKNEETHKPKRSFHVYSFSLAPLSLFHGQNGTHQLLSGHHHIFLNLHPTFYILSILHLLLWFLKTFSILIINLEREREIAKWLSTVLESFESTISGTEWTVGFWFSVDSLDFSGAE